MADSVFPSTGDTLSEANLRRMFKRAANAADYVAAAGDFKVTKTANALEVSVAAGEAFVNGTWIKRDVASVLSALPANTTGLKVYAAYDDSTRNTVSIGHTTAALAAHQILLALVNTDASTVTSVTDKRNLVATGGWGQTA